MQLHRPLAFIDLETTGVNLGTDRIVEIAIVKQMPDGTRQVKRKLINPEMPIPVSSSDVHGGITDQHSTAGRAPFRPAGHATSQRALLVHEHQFIGFEPRPFAFSIICLTTVSGSCGWPWGDQRN